MSKGVAGAVQQEAAGVRTQRKLEKDNARRKRKQGAIDGLRVELECADPERALAIRSMFGDWQPVQETCDRVRC